MKKNLLTISVLLLSFTAFSQSNVLTFVGNGATVTVQDQALVYNGGGWKSDAGSTVTAMGDIMVVGAPGGSDVFQVADNSFILDFDTEPAADKKIYGQLYLSNITQGNISGKINKIYRADYLHGATGRQQLALPFYNFTIGDLKGTQTSATTNFSFMQFTNTSLNSAGRFNPASVFKYNNDKSRYDQIAGADTDVIGKPTDYYIVPRRNSSEILWNPEVNNTVFRGTPVSDVSGSTQGFTLDFSTIATFGSGGNSQNYFREKYNTYLEDPFVSDAEPVNWTNNTYSKRLNLFANPFLTNIDLHNIAETGLSNVLGIAYYTAGAVEWNPTTGAEYTNSAMVKVTTSYGIFQSGDIDDLLIKPMQEVLIKFTDATEPVMNLNNTRRFAQVVRAADTPYSVTANRNALPTDKIVKQLKVTLKNASGEEIGKTYYAVSPSAVTGAQATEIQAYTSGSYALYTKEEALEGGEDVNFSQRRLYINAANEISFQGKEIPMVVNTADAASFTFELFEAGVKLPVSESFNNGKSFYIKKDNVVTEIKSGDTLPAASGNYGLYYEKPEGFLSTSAAAKANTVIARKDQVWVVRFANTWKSADVEVYSATGQLLSAKKNISTAADYIIPLRSDVNGLFLVKAVSEKGEIVIKKIVK